MPLKVPPLPQQRCYLDGVWCGAGRNDTAGFTSPATGETRRAIGVCAAITSWNFKAAIITSKAGSYARWL